MKRLLLQIGSCLQWRNYDNPQCEGEEEFYEDIKRFKYLKRLFKKYYESGNLKERLILNHMIILSNVFGVQAASTLLIFKLEPEILVSNEIIYDIFKYVTRK